jgi:serine protease DegQ
LRRLTTTQRSLSGAELEELNPSLGEYFGGVSQGVFVLRTTEGTPAVAAGLRAGDILESVNGRRVTTISDLLTAVSQQTGPINLAIVRRGQRSTITLRR